MVLDLQELPRFDIKKPIGSSRPFHDVDRLFQSEIVDLIKTLFNESLSEPIRLGIRKYLTVSIFPALDYFFRLGRYAYGDEKWPIQTRNQLSIWL